MPLFSTPQVQRAWLSQEQVGVLRKRLTYFTIPAFDLASGGFPVSIAISNCNYALDNNFVIPILPEPSIYSNVVTFIPCIRWREDETGFNIHRYKLWEGYGETIPYPLYNGEKIGKNFTIEIWDIPGVSRATNDDDLNVFTSFRQKPDNVGDLSDVQAGGVIVPSTFVALESLTLNLPLIFGSEAIGGDN